jgi:hypothetical protein
MADRGVNLDNPLTGGPGNYSVEYTIKCKSCSVISEILISTATQTQQDERDALGETKSVCWCLCTQAKKIKSFKNHDR